ncbi:hypothetical protein [Bradyrhizobium sp. RDM4]|uniref:hypothetical protein n=1 Tax=Bradyrhizobium sp. RDM4 TaxID=3378765 RepID=UPI0038FCD2D9
MECEIDRLSDDELDEVAGGMNAFMLRWNAFITGVYSTCGQAGAEMLARSADNAGMN